MIVKTHRFGGSSGGHDLNLLNIFSTSPKRQVCILPPTLNWFTFLLTRLLGYIRNIRIYHEYDGSIEKIRPDDRRLASRGLPSDDKR